MARPFTIFTSGAGPPASAIPSSIGTTSVTPGAFLTAAVTAPILSAATTI